MTPSRVLRLFEDPAPAGPERESLGPGATVLRGFALPFAASVLAAFEQVVASSPLRHMVTPGGLRMSVEMTNCGLAGWVSDRGGYRYDCADPLTGEPWPQMPGCFARLATEAATQAGFDGFVADSCLINRYAPGTRLSLHQDRNEQDFGQPIVSVSLGMPAIFLFGGPKRSDRPRRVPLEHGDVVVWGGPDRLRYHGVMPLQDGDHPMTGRFRINLTFRKAFA